MSTTELNTKSNTTVCGTDQIICPNCGKVENYVEIEGLESGEYMYECEECHKIFKLDVEFEGNIIKFKSTIYGRS